MFKVRAHSEPWTTDAVGILVQENRTDGRRFVVTNMEFKELAPGAWVDATLRLTQDRAQELMDDLWRCGLRPTEGRGSAGALAATERHLEDMRALVFKTQQPRHR